MDIADQYLPVATKKVTKQIRLHAIDPCHGQRVPFSPWLRSDRFIHVSLSQLHMAVSMHVARCSMHTQDFSYFFDMYISPVASQVGTSCENCQLRHSALQPLRRACNSFSPCHEHSTALVQDCIEELESQGTASATASAEVATARAEVATVTAERDAMHKKLAAAKRSITALRSEHDALKKAVDGLNARYETATDP